MTFEDFSELFFSKLQGKYDDAECRAILGLVLEHVTQVERGQQRSMLYNLVPENILAALNQILEKLETGMPVQYALSFGWFLNSLYFVNQDVLIPRPETEELVLWITETLRANNIANGEMLDIGTGSGCIAIATKQILPKLNVTAIDISEAALTVAKENASRLQTAISFKPVNFLNSEEHKKLGIFDAIVSNPPYIPLKEKQKMETNVTHWEPELALFTPDNDPQIFYKSIGFFALKHLSPIGFVMVEGHQDYLAETQTVFEQLGFTTELKHDMHGNLRMLKAKPIVK